MSISRAILLSSLCCVLNSSFIHAQDLTNKEGIPILPQAKNWSIGLDATRLIKNADFNFTSSSQAITGKYFINATTAYRFSVREAYNKYTTKVMVDDRVAASSSVVAYPSATVMKENVWKRTTAATGISFGIEKRRGVSRLQGVYGIEATVFILSSSDAFTYGNALSASNSNPVIVDSKNDAITSSKFGSANNIDSVPKIQGVIGSARMISRKNGIGFSVGARAFIGAEYFFLPKMSIGGEFGYALTFTNYGRSETVLESIGQSNVPGSVGKEVKRTTIDGGKDSHFGIDTDNASTIGGLSASLRLNLYF